jgi:hypothetical protein
MHFFLGLTLPRHKNVFGLPEIPVLSANRRFD